MAHYTVTIKTLLDNGFDLGLQDYPIFNESYRNILNKKILDHYYMDEIGYETAELFKHFLNARMNEIMSYYNELYINQEKLITDTLENVNLYENSTRNNTNTVNTENKKKKKKGEELKISNRDVQKILEKFNFSSSSWHYF